ncbi:MAG: hypothetical protein JWN76_1249 [Chitinophagaceae bacterium]|nr:hypothetical protein [Chitinophagaceae bacterium]
MRDYKFDFIAKWTTKIINAVPKPGGGYRYVIESSFIPANEVYKPYSQDQFTDEEAVKVLHGSTALDLLMSSSGTNLNITMLVCEPAILTKRVFQGTVDVASGDSLLILVPLT